MKSFSLIHHIFVHSLPMKFWSWFPKFILIIYKFDDYLHVDWLERFEKNQAGSTSDDSSHLAWTIKGDRVRCLVDGVTFWIDFKTQKQKIVHKKLNKLYWYSSGILEYISRNNVTNFIGKWLLICLLIYYLFECRRINFHTYIWRANESFFQKAKWESHTYKM